MERRERRALAFLEQDLEGQVNCLRAGPASSCVCEVRGSIGCQDCVCSQVFT